MIPPSIRYQNNTPNPPRKTSCATSIRSLPSPAGSCHRHNAAYTSIEVKDNQFTVARDGPLEVTVTARTVETPNGHHLTFYRAPSLPETAVPNEVTEYLLRVFT